MTKGRVVVGLSGGVDSSVAAYLLRQEGYEVEGIYMRNWRDGDGLTAPRCPFDEDVDFAEMVARRLKIPFSVVDLSEAYRKQVVEYLFAEYAKGRTPNPDVLCNREIKFSAFWEEAQRRGADFVATGHYCRRGIVSGHSEPIYRLLTGVDLGKDQSYFLCQVTQEQLAHSLFPVGGLQKAEVRSLAKELGLATASRRDSYGICFIGEVDLPLFLSQRIAPQEGEIVEVPIDLQPPSREKKDLYARSKPYPLSRELGRIVGKHNGAHNFTIGQRKGLGIGGVEKPLYVVGTDVEQNLVYAAQGQEHTFLYRDVAHISAETTHWVRPDLQLPINKTLRVKARLRHRQQLQPALLISRAEGLYLEFDKPQRGVSPGQFAAWYVGDELIGSGPVAW